MSSMHGGARRAVTCGALAALAALAAASGVVAQQSEPLEEVERLVRAGRTEEARAALVDWWDTSWPSASRRDAQRGLWLRGRLTVAPAEAELDFRRLVIEFPGGPFSDEALMRLVQSAHARGDLEAAQRHVAELERDYPGSAASRAAARWLAEAGSPLATVATEALVERPDTATPGRITGAAPPEDAPPAVPASPTGRYSVQIGAFAASAGATSVRDRAVGLGVQARLVRVPGSPLIHVRVGRFDSMQAARDFLADVELLGFPATLVQDADREESIGG